MDSFVKFNYYRFLKKLIFFTLILAAIGYALSMFIPENYLSPTLPYLYVFFFAVSIIVHYVLVKVSEQRTNQFVNYFMLLTFGKLIFYLSLILVYMLVYRSDIVPFVGAFFILYLFFTVFEVNESLSITRQMKERINQKQSES